MGTAKQVRLSEHLVEETTSSPYHVALLERNLREPLEISRNRPALPFSDRANYRQRTETHAFKITSY
jgi:hypothetical protein